MTLCRHHMAVALYSLISGKPARSDLAMTGESHCVAMFSRSVDS